MDRSRASYGATAQKAHAVCANPRARLLSSVSDGSSPKKSRYLPATRPSSPIPQRVSAIVTVQATSASPARSPRSLCSRRRRTWDCGTYRPCRERRGAGPAGPLKTTGRGLPDEWFSERATDSARRRQSAGLVPAAIAGRFALRADVGWRRPCPRRRRGSVLGREKRQPHPARGRPAGGARRCRRHRLARTRDGGVRPDQLVVVQAQSPRATSALAARATQRKLPEPTIC